MLLTECVSDKDNNFPAFLYIQLSVCLVSASKQR